MFTLSSIACGLAWNIESMIAFRALQGFIGGAMVPTVFATGFTLFEGKQRAMIPAILGMVSVLAPTLGPTVGGLITEALDWRWIFFINVVPGIAVTIAVIWLVRIDKPDVSMFGRIDWVHLASMATFLAGLEYVLEEGPKQGWFERWPRSRSAAWVSAVAFLLFLERSFLLDHADRQAQPVPQADLRLRLRVQPRHRLRPVRLHLSGPDLSRPGARL